MLLNTNYLINALNNTEGVKSVRGRGLMIGFEMEAGLEDLRKVLLNDLKIFTGEATPERKFNYFKET